MIDEFLWKHRGPAFLRSLTEAAKELRRNARALKNDAVLNRDVVDPTSKSLKRCFGPIRDCLWDDCRPGYNPLSLQALFGTEPKPKEVKTYRIWKARYQKVKDHVRAIEEYCRAGQERFPNVAAKYEFIRLEVIRKCESPPESMTAKHHEQINSIMNALNEISILTIGDLVRAAKASDADEKVAGGKTEKRKHGKCTSRFAGRTIRNLSVAADGVTFTVCRDYTYKITAKQAIEFLDKLIESYEKTNQPVKAEFQVAAVFKRGDAMRFKKRFMVCKNGSVHLNIPC